MSTFTCDDCGESKPVQTNGGTGRAHSQDGKTICYACCAIRDKSDMIATGRATLYLVAHGKGFKLSNWPGTLELFLHRAPRVGQHNRTGKRYDVWFTGPDGKRWHGVQYGDNTQICHCRRPKSKPGQGIPMRNMRDFDKL